ncbi:MAG: calcium-translocating P-type ATPase, SERCA-type [Candidatus Aenigmatarchaeota archaeon]
MEWHKSEIKDVFESLHTGENGLTSDEAKQRLQKYGLNQIEEKKKTSDIVLFLNQFRSVLISILIVATAISAFLGEILDAAVIFIIVVMNAFLGFFQEKKAEKALEALKKLAAPNAEVMRGGMKKIPASEIVPGDIIILNVGDRVPADCRIIDSVNLKANESILTGESLPVEKSTTTIGRDVPVAERSNMIFSGTCIVYGRCRAVVVETAMQTEFGKIAKMLQVAEEKTPLQEKLAILGKQIGLIIVAICVIVFVSGFALGGEITEMFLTAVTLAVAAIPEGLPAIVTITLAIGLQKMAGRNAIIRRLPAVETLGCATVICTDKTGTLTMNEMTVKKIYVNEKVFDVTGEGYGINGKILFAGKEIRSDSIELLLKTGLLCNDSELENKIGDPTELALLVSARKYGLENTQAKRTNEIQFDSERKMMSVLVDGAIYAKGAVEEVLKRCSHFYKDGKTLPLMESDRRKIMETNHSFASTALRVLAFAFRESDELKEERLIFIGLQGMIDPPRAEAKDAIERCKLAGIKVVMITGDHKDTATAIAKELNLLDGKVLTGEELNAMSDEKFYSIVDDISVYARVSPEHKVRITETLRKKGEVVAMTGDGINDAPALKKSDIGIAMGITGTDVSKEASDMVLADDNFSSIVNAVEEGRGIYDNIKKFVYYLLACNFGEVLVIFVAIILSIVTGSAILLPLLPLQILWMNLLTDGLPALALGVEQKEPDIMKRKPRDQKEKILNKNSLAFIIFVGAIMCAGTLFSFYTEPNIDKARTLAFTTLVMFQLFFVLSMRSSAPLIKVGILSNKKLLLAIAVSVALQAAIIYMPFLSAAFKTVPLSFIDWLEIIAISASIFVVLEIKKFISGKNK